MNGETAGQRRLMAIMFSDIVGYTSIMQQNEAEAKSVRDRSEEVIRQSVRSYNGELIQFYGDGVLSVFSSAIQAARCAVAIQRSMKDLPNAQLRIGIHVGDVVYGKDGVYGDAVNLASRIEGIAPPGGVAVSAKVYDEIRNQPGLESVSLGTRSLKNVLRPIEVFALKAEGLLLPSHTPQEKIRAIVVDDEELARNVIREYLARHPEVEIMQECSNGFEAVKAITELNPDLVFLDIQMPKLTGFEVLELIDRKPAVIFTTAYDEFALRAFEVHAVDYLLKPFSQDRLDEALRHVSSLAGKQGEAALKELSASVRSEDRSVDRLLIRDGSKVHILHVDSIDYLEAKDDYSDIRSGGQHFLKQTTLTALESELDPRRFVRIHRSYILNLDRLSRIELYAKDSRVAILQDGARLPVSRSGYARLKELM